MTFKEKIQFQKKEFSPELKAFVNRDLSPRTGGVNQKVHLIKNFSGKEFLLTCTFPNTENPSALNELSNNIFTASLLPEGVPGKFY